MDDQAPLRSFRVRNPGAPWFSVVLRARIRKRNAVYRRARRSGSVLAWAKYSRFRDELVADLRRAQSDHCLESVRVGGGGQIVARVGLSDLLDHLLLAFLPRSVKFIFCYRVLCLFGLLDY